MGRKIVKRKTRPQVPLDEVLNHLAAIGLDDRLDTKESQRWVDAANQQSLWLPTSPTQLAPTPRFFDGVLAHGLHGLLHGPQKSLKSTIAAHLCVAIAAGVPLFGDFTCQRPGPVVMFSGEGGLDYALDRIDRVCNVYGVKRKSLELLVLPWVQPINQPSFLIPYAEAVMSVQPIFTSVEPLYLYGPHGWDGTNLNTWDVSAFDAINQSLGITTLLGGHDKRGLASSASPGASATGVGPPEWAGQILSLKATEEWKGNGHPHSLKFKTGGRGVGGNVWHLSVDDDTLQVTAKPFDDTGDKGKTKATSFDRLVRCAPLVFDNGTSAMPLGQFCEELAGLVEVMEGLEITGESIRRKYVKELLRQGAIHTVAKSVNEHLVGPGAAPEEDEEEARIYDLTERMGG